MASLRRFSETDRLINSHLGEAYFEIDGSLFVASYQAGKADWHNLGECHGAALAVGFAEGKVVTLANDLSRMGEFNPGQTPEYTTFGDSTISMLKLFEKNYRDEKLLIHVSPNDSEYPSRMTFSFHVGITAARPEVSYKTLLDTGRSPIHPSCEELVTNRGVRTKLQSIAVHE